MPAHMDLIASLSVEITRYAIFVVAIGSFLGLCAWSLLRFTIRLIWHPIAKQAGARDLGRRMDELAATIDDLGEELRSTKSR